MFFIWVEVQGVQVHNLGGTMYLYVPRCPPRSDATDTTELATLKKLKFLNFTSKMKILFNEISKFNVLLNAETGKKILLHAVVAQNCISLRSSKQSVRI
jgi:hypothetical protein